MGKEDNTLLRMNQRYSVLAKNRGRVDLGVFSHEPRQVMPNPTELDYERGRITRFFVRKVSDKRGPVVEVDVAQYESFKKNPLNTTTTLTWLLSGPIYDKPGDGNQGVYDSNFRQIMRGDEKLKGIAMKLFDPLQFYYYDPDTHIPS